MRRRALLASIAGGTTAALAGCFDQRGPGTDTEDGDGTTTTTTRTTTSPGSADLFVWNEYVQYGIVIPFSADSIGISKEDTQYYFVRLDGPADVGMEDFALAVGDRRVGPTVIENLYHTRWGNDAWYGEAESEGLLAFEVPGDLPDGDARLTYPGGQHALDDDLARQLGDPQSSWSATLEVPAEVASTHPFTTVEVQITNESDRPARFVGALNRRGPSVAYTPEGPVSAVIPAGSTNGVTVQSDWDEVPADGVGDGEPDVFYGLDYVGGEASAEVRIVEGDGPTETRTATPTP